MLIPRPRSVLLIFFLLAGSLSPPDLRGQDAIPRGGGEDGGSGIVLQPNSPNPVSSETWIPFILPPSLFDSGGPVRVTMRIFNILYRAVAIPTAVDHPRGAGTRVLNLEYTEPGTKIAYWDGKDPAGNLVPSGVYYMQLVVPGHPPLTRKLIVDNPRRRRDVFPW